MRCIITIKPDKASTQMVNLFAKIWIQTIIYQQKENYYIYIQDYNL